MVFWWILPSLLPLVCINLWMIRYAFAIERRIQLADHRIAWHSRSECLFLRTFIRGTPDRRERTPTWIIWSGSCRKTPDVHDGWNRIKTTNPFRAGPIIGVISRVKKGTHTPQIFYGAADWFQKTETVKGYRSRHVLELVSEFVCRRTRGLIRPDWRVLRAFVFPSSALSAFQRARGKNCDAESDTVENSEVGKS